MRRYSVLVFCFHFLLWEPASIARAQAPQNAPAAITHPAPFISTPAQPATSSVTNTSPGEPSLPEVLPSDPLALQPAVPGGDPNGQATIQDLENRLNAMHNEILRLSARNRAFGIGGGYVPSTDFMPPPADPTNLFFNETSLADVNLGAGSRIPGTSLIFRTALSGAVQGWYDTGNVGSGSQFNPATIAIKGDSAQGAGAFRMAEGNGQLKIDLNAPISVDQQVQAFLETALLNGELQVRHAFGRADFGFINVLAGKYWTAWGDEGVIPKSINTGDSYTAGTCVQTGVPQLRFVVPTEYRVAYTFAVQDPLANNIAALAPTDVGLNRYPDLAGRIRFFDGDFFSVSVGSIMHVMGREDVLGQESFDIGWGFNAATRFRTSQRGALMLGAVTGQGIGSSIFGLSNAFTGVTAANGNLSTLGSDGVYFGHQRQWTSRTLGTIAYGFAEADGVTAMPAVSRSSHNLWANLIVQLNDNFAYGLQYDYGNRRNVVDQTGDDHRFTFVVQITTGQKDKTDKAKAAAGRSASDQADAADVLRSVPTDSGRSRFSRL